MSTLSTVTIELSLGDRIFVGKNRKPATITKIEYHERTGEIVLKTTAGTRKALTFAMDTE